MNGSKLKEFQKNMIGKVAGNAAAVFLNGEKAFENFEGFSDAERRIPVDKNTVFRLASMTKPVTATSVLLCVEDGLLSLDEPVKTYLPSFSDTYIAKKSGDKFVKGERTKTEITLRALLCHSSGLGSGEAGNAQYSAVKPCGTDKLSDAVERYSEVLLDFEPFTAQAYSAVMGLDVAARCVEVASGKDYADFIRERIAEPLGLKTFVYKKPDEKVLAKTYAHKDGKLVEYVISGGFESFPDGYTGGGAGLMANLGDYCAFAESIRKSFNGKGILSKTSVEEMKKPQLSENIAGLSPYFNWGLGVRTVSASCDWQPIAAGSFGWSGAYGTHFWIDHENGLTAVYMHNSATYGGSGAPHTIEFEKAVYADFIK